MLEMINALIREHLNWDAADASIEYQADGLTNSNYIVSKGNLKYVIRISGGNSERLGINRHAELAAMKSAYTAGIGAEVVCFSTDNGNMITKFIEGKKLSNENLASDEYIGRIAGTLKRVHGLPAIQYDFSPYDDIENRIRYAVQNKLELPDYLGGLLYKLNSIRRERENGRRENRGLCHNDPFANNFLDDGTIRLIDWEYAGMGDIYFDLSCVCMFFPRSQKEEFLRCYFGKCDPGKLRNLEQMSFVMSFWNAMWAVLQTGLADGGHDFKSMAGYIFTHLNEALQTKKEP